MTSRLLLSLALLAALVAPAAQGQTVPTEAWFLRYTWTPNQDSIAGLPVRAINRRWHKALVLTPALFPAMSHDDSAEVREYVWGVGGDLNHDGSPDSVLTGVFAGSGGPGRFLLVLSRNPTGRWQPVFVKTTADGAGFSALSVREGQIYWMGCMSCGDQSHLLPTSAGFRLEYEGD